MSVYNITVEEYSEKALAIRGEDTKTIKEQLKGIGAKWNANLKNGAGWILPKTKRSQLDSILQTSPSSSSQPKTSKEPTTKLPYVKNSFEKEKYITYEQFLNLVSRVEKLEAMLSCSRSRPSISETKSESTITIESDGEPDERPTHTRLLHPKSS